MEPGLLSIFRLYAWLRVGTLVSMIAIDRKSHPAIGSSSDLTSILVFLTFNTLALLGYLYWPWLMRKMGRWCIPVAVAFAAGGLIVEQHILSVFRTFFQPLPFLYILLVLVAWQYRFSRVVLFSVGTAVLQFALLLLYPQPPFFDLPALVENEPMVTYGLIVSRTISFIVLGYIVVRLMNAQRQQRQDLAQANRKLVRHAAALEHLAVSRERNRLSRELHDTVAHTLSALAVQLEALTTVLEPIPPKAQTMLQGMIATTRTGLDETRRALGALRASPLEELGLGLAVRALAEDTASRAALDLELAIAEDLSDLPEEVEQAFYRVTQEALENAAQHAGATHLWVCLGQNGRGLSLTVRDDGAGMDVGQAQAGPRHGFGLQGMLERAGLIDADLEVESSPGSGTTVRLWWERPHD